VIHSGQNHFSDTQQAKTTLFAPAKAQQAKTTLFAPAKAQQAKTTLFACGRRSNVC
jgi:hypothetical protein